MVADSDRRSQSGRGEEQDRQAPVIGSSERAVPRATFLVEHCAGTCDDSGEPDKNMEPHHGQEHW